MVQPHSDNAFMINQSIIIIIIIIISTFSFFPQNARILHKRARTNNRSRRHHHINFQVRTYQIVKRQVEGARHLSRSTTQSEHEIWALAIKLLFDR